MVAGLIRKSPADRAGAHVATRDVMGEGGVAAVPVHAVDYREVAAVQYVGEMKTKESWE